MQVNKKLIATVRKLASERRADDETSAESKPTFPSTPTVPFNEYQNEKMVGVYKKMGMTTKEAKDLLAKVTARIYLEANVTRPPVAQPEVKEGIRLFCKEAPVDYASFKLAYCSEARKTLS